MPKFTSKGAITALILMAVAIAAGVFISDRAGPPNGLASAASDSATPVNTPLDEIKIDQVFVRNMFKDKADAAIVHAVIGLARSLDLRVVAEGVEDHESLSRLAHLHCDVAQGYLLGRPAPIEELPQAALGNIRPDWPPFV